MGGKLENITWKQFFKIVFLLVSILLITGGAYELTKLHFFYQNDDILLHFNSISLLQESKFGEILPENYTHMQVLVGSSAQKFLESTDIIGRCGDLKAERIYYVHNENGTFISGVLKGEKINVKCDFIK